MPYLFIVLYFLCFLIIISIELKSYKTLFTPITFFSLLWCIIGMGANSGFLGYYQPSLLVNICILSGIIIFAFIFISFTSRSKLIKKSEMVLQNCFVRYGRMYLFGIIGFLILLPRLFSSLRLMLGGYGMAFIRANLANQEVGLSYGGIYDNIVSTFVRGIFVAINLIAIVLLFSKQPRKKVYYLLIFSYILIIAFSIVDAGRGAIIASITYLILAISIFKRNFIRNLLTNKIIWFCAIIVLVITSMRANKFSILQYFDTFYLYYFAGPTYLTQLLAYQPEYAIGGKLLYGAATFGFITNWFSWAWMFFTKQHVGSSHLLGSVITNQIYPISPYHSANAMCTCFYSFLIDWSYFGIVIGPMVLAFTSVYLYKKFYTTLRVRACVMYIFWSYILIRTIFKLDTIGFGLPVVYVATLLFLGKSYGTDKKS